jgi:Flp pilus assembly pilin Flp
MTLRAFLARNEGQTMSEYALLLGVISLSLILVVGQFGLERARLFDDAVRALMP